MARICWVVPRIKRSTFTGGIYSIMKHADGLAARGHEVVVVPLQPSPYPEWFREFSGTVRGGGRIDAIGSILRAQRQGSGLERGLHAISSALSIVEPRAFPFMLRHAALCERARAVLPNADITIATSFETALAVSLHGRGKHAYYCQHFEPYFCKEFDEPIAAEALARASYMLPLELVTNSSWLAKKIYDETGRNVHGVAGNAIEEVMFADRPLSSGQTLRVISYGGRGAEWKGFAEMAAAVGMARSKGVALDWAVYGGCAMPPDNPVAKFRHLGFLNSRALAAAYRQSNVLLSASWYESFPLFPLEAMASGLATITTQLGTEEFARHMETAWVVPSRDPEALCSALVSLAADSAAVQRLGAAGIIEARRHTWPLAVERMERLLLDILD